MYEENNLTFYQHSALVTRWFRATGIDGHSASE